MREAAAITGASGVGEEVRPGALAQQGDDLGARGDVAAGGAAEGLAEGAGDDVDAVHDAVQLGVPRPPGPTKPTACESSTMTMAS